TETCALTARRKAAKRCKMGRGREDGRCAARAERRGVTHLPSRFPGRRASTRPPGRSIPLRRPTLLSLLPRTERTALQAEAHPSTWTTLNPRRRYPRSLRALFL